METEYQRFLVARLADGREISVDITHCCWCAGREHICTACAANADAARASEVDSHAPPK